MSNRQSLTYAGFGLQCHTCTYSGPGQFNLSRTNNKSATYKVSCANCWSKEGETILRKKKAAELRAALKALNNYANEIHEEVIAPIIEAASQGGGDGTTEVYVKD